MVKGSDQFKNIGELVEVLGREVKASSTETTEFTTVTLDADYDGMNITFNITYEDDKPPIIGYSRRDDEGMQEISVSTMEFKGLYSICTYGERSQDRDFGPSEGDFEDCSQEADLDEQGIMESFKFTRERVYGLIEEAIGKVMGKPFNEIRWINPYFDHATTQELEEGAQRGMAFAYASNFTPIGDT